MRYLAFCGAVLTAMWSSASTARVEGDELVQQLLNRQASLSGMTAEFVLTMYYWPKDKDPFDPENWGRTDPPQLKCNGRLVRRGLDFRIDLSFSGATSLSDASHSWIDGVRTVKTRGEDDGVWSVIRDREFYRIQGPLPFLTPLELTVFDYYSAPLGTLLEAEELRIESGTAEALVLRPGPGSSAGEPPRESILVRFDQSRGLLPRELSARLDLADGRFQQWEMRTTGTTECAGVDLIREAVIVNRNPHFDFLSVFHFVADRLEIRAKTAASQMEIELPTANYRLLDELSGEVKDVAADGRVTFHRIRSPEEMQQAQEAISAAFEAQQKTEDTLAARRGAFRWIVAGAVTGVAAVAVVFRLRRRRGSLTP